MEPVLLAWSDAAWAVMLQDPQGRCAGLVYLGDDLPAAQQAAALAASGIHNHLECQWVEIPCTCGFVEGAQPASDPAAHSSDFGRVVGEGQEGRGSQ